MRNINRIMLPDHSPWLKLPKFLLNIIFDVPLPKRSYKDLARQAFSPTEHKYFIFEYISNILRVDNQGHTWCAPSALGLTNCFLPWHRSFPCYNCRPLHICTLVSYISSRLDNHGRHHHILRTWMNAKALGSSAHSLGTAMFFLDRPIA